MRTTHLACVGALLGAWAVVAVGPVRAMPPFVAAETEWSEAGDGRSLTYVGTRSLLVRLPFDLDRVRMTGLAARVSTDAREVVVVVGRERVRVELGGEERNEASEVSLGRAGTSEGVRVGGSELLEARAAWIRILGGMETSGVLEFPRATYVVVEVAGEDGEFGQSGAEGADEHELGPEGAASSGEPNSGESDSDDETEAEAERAAREDLTPEYVDGVPRIGLVRDEPATRVYEAAQRLSGAFKCGSCGGSTRVTKTEVTGYRRYGTMREPITRQVTRACDPCRATGYRDNRSDRRFMDTFVERLARADPEHPRYELGRGEQWPEKLREILEINPGATTMVNRAAYERLRDAQDQEIGSPVWFVGEREFDKPVWLREREGQLHEYVSVNFPEARMIVLVTEPRIEHAVSGKYCIVGGVLAGFAFPDQRGAGVVPVLQGGFIVGR